jgi:hypothetical protein
MDYQHMLKRFESLSDEELALFLGSQRDSYTSEAIEIMRKVAETRGLVIKLDAASSDPEPLLEHDGPDPPDRRLLRASLIAPSAVVLVMVVVNASTSGAMSAEAWVMIATYCFIVFAPVTYLTWLLVGLPTYVVLQRAHRLRLPYLVGAGAFIGIPSAILSLLGTGLVIPFFGFTVEFLLLMAAVGAASGGFGGAVFWRITLRNGGD